MPKQSRIFPDQSHVDKVREALAMRPISRASVMVGSGFSRNATKKRFDVQDPPLWDDVAKAIVGKLYPERGDSAKHAISADNALRFAQEYKTAHGRSALHGLLDKLVRNLEFVPDETHQRLLNLPWRDIFTTNWDTLLDRATDVPDTRYYGKVDVMEQLPLVSQPRIMHLHGAFPSTFPLIITEEDYRTYPTDFAPFVNTVQQAMMETVTCLIGFSGDDPNFLNWSGWVRDNLGESAPMIYLAGWLNLSPHRRRMLEHRGVMPIDLARHPDAESWGLENQHEHATEWFLEALEVGQPYDELAWPAPSESTDQPENEISKRMIGPLPESPKRELARVYEQDDRDREPMERVRKQLGIWAHNRRRYPRWLVFPTGIERTEFLQITENWEPPILNAAVEMSEIDQLNAIRELVWRHEVLLRQISYELEAAAENVLSTIDIEAREINGVASVRDDWSEITKAWTDVALALVIDARIECTPNLFEERLNPLVRLAEDDREVSHKIQHERSLWAVYSLDFHKLNALLDDWAVENSDPAWAMRKSALLAEAGRGGDASALIHSAIDSLRKEQSRVTNVGNTSRESWAMAATLSMRNRRNVFRRWDELGSRKFDAWTELDNVERAITEQNSYDEAPSFDHVVVRNKGTRLSNAQHARASAAYRAVRLTEIAGLPPVNVPDEDLGWGSYGVSGILARAAEALVSVNPELAVQLVLRVCSYDRDKTLERVLSRERIAAFPEETAVKLAKLSIDAIEYALPKAFESERHPSGLSSIERMRVALEVLSRLVMRVPSQIGEIALDLALDCYRTEGVAQHHWLAPPLGKLFRRVWQSLPEDRRSTRSIDLLMSPLPGLDGFTPSPQCPDPANFVTNNDLKTVGEVDEDKRKQALDFLLRGLMGPNITRSRTVGRIMVLVQSESLNESDTSEIARALWLKSDPVLQNPTGSNSIWDWVYVLLPQQESGAAIDSFRHKWLSPESIFAGEEAGFAVNVLEQVGAAVDRLPDVGLSLELSADEELHIAQQIMRFVESFDSRTVKFNLGIGSAITGMGSLASHVTLSKEVADDLFAATESFLETSYVAGNPMIKPLVDARRSIGYALIPGLAKANPESIPTLTKWLTDGLTSTEDSHKIGAISAIQSWVAVSDNEMLEMVPDGLIREIGATIAYGRGVGLSSALLCAITVLEKGLETQLATISPLALRGLSVLGEILSYDDPDQSVANDIHTLRLLCVQLAVCLAKIGSETDATIMKWLEIGKNDPFPETRNEVLFATSDRDDEPVN